MSSSRQTRSGSLGSNVALTLNDVKALITQSEEKIISKLDTIMSSITALEKRFDDVQAEQIRIGLEVMSVKEVIVKQQEQIERLESERRQMNLIFTNIPEDDVKVDDHNLQDDMEKLSYLCESIDADFEREDIASCSRIGMRKNGRRRLLLVKYNDMNTRRRILSSQRSLRNNASCVSSFGQIYVNKDSSILVRKEEKRLRDVMKDLKSSSDPADRIYIRSGKLYHDSKLVDEIKFANQLF